MKGNPGTIIHATMRVEDLLPAFLHELERLDTEHKYSEEIKEGKQLIEIATVDPSYWNIQSTVEFCWETLVCALDTFAPDNHYFGSHPGDGSDYGFWEADNDY